MEETQNYSEQKDKILKYLLENEGHPSITKISANLDLDHHLCFFLSEKIEERGFIESRGINTREAGKSDKILTLKPSGKIFLKDGGFQAEAKKEKEKSRRETGFKFVDITHKIITTIVAVGTLGLGYYSITLQSEVNKIDSINSKIIEPKLMDTSKDTLNQDN